MIKINRPAAEPWLQSNEQKWGQRFAANRATNPNFVFQWPTYRGNRINHLLQPLLRNMTNDHCSFCDGYPLEPMGATIEHFKPKDLFPLESCKWENLFYCCSECQKKGNQYDPALLKPDEAGYEFDTYFIYNARTGKLHPNPKLPAAEQERAEITIKLYRLNEANRPNARQKALDFQIEYNIEETDDLPYRFLY